jgi:hypothetical protein
MGFLIRWKAQKRIKLGDQQIAQTQLLFNTRRGEIGLPYHIIIEEWLQQ